MHNWADGNLTVWNYKTGGIGFPVSPVYCHSILRVAHNRALSSQDLFRWSPRRPPSFPGSRRMRRYRECDRPVRGPRCFAESNTPVGTWEACHSSHVAQTLLLSWLPRYHLLLIAGFTIYESQVDKKVPKKLRHRMNPVPFDFKYALEIKVNCRFPFFPLRWFWTLYFFPKLLFFLI